MSVTLTDCDYVDCLYGLGSALLVQACLQLPSAVVWVPVIDRNDTALLQFVKLTEDCGMSVVVAAFPACAICLLTFAEACRASYDQSSSSSTFGICYGAYWAAVCGGVL